MKTITKKKKKMLINFIFYDMFRFKTVIKAKMIVHYLSNN